MVLFLFSSQTMKDNSSLIKIPIKWTGLDVHSFSVEGAIYPEEYNGLPLKSIHLEGDQISDFVIAGIRKTEFHLSFQEKLGQKQIPNCNLVNLRKLAERGHEVSVLDIFPIEYDSASNTYFRIDYLDIELKKDRQEQSTSNARTGENDGN